MPEDKKPTVIYHCDESHYETVNLDDVDEPTDAELDAIVDAAADNTELDTIENRELLEDFDFDNFMAIFDEFWNGSE